MSTRPELARESLRQLVKHVFDQRGQPLQPITYGELSRRIARRPGGTDDRFGVGMGAILGVSRPPVSGLRPSQSARKSFSETRSVNPSFFAASPIHSPEILAYVAATTAGLALTKSVIDLVVAVVKARTEGVKKGDGPRHDLELIVRRFDKRGEYAEEKILRISSTDEIDVKNLVAALDGKPVLESPKKQPKKKAKKKK